METETEPMHKGCTRKKQLAADSDPCGYVRTGPCRVRDFYRTLAYPGLQPRLSQRGLSGLNVGSYWPGNKCLPPVKIRLWTIRAGLVSVSDVNGPQNWVVHFFWEQVELRVAVPEQHVVTPFPPQNVPGAFRVGSYPVSMPWAVAGYDFVAWADTDFR